MAKKEKIEMAMSVCMLSRKDSKVRVLRAAYSRIYRADMRWDLRHGGSWQVDRSGNWSHVRGDFRYELGTRRRERTFPLDALPYEICTKNHMTRSTNTCGAKESSSAVVRMYERVHVGWRKIATAAAAVLALGMGYHVIFGQNGLTVYQQKRQETLSLDNQLHSLQRENGLLKGHVERLQSDPNAIEHQAREELHYTRPGEVIYTLPASPGATSSTSSASR
jgi:cell division protein FtsB